MAQKRMFSLQVTDTDRFLDMPTSAQALYFHLGMHGDDDGFVDCPKKIARAAGCNSDDLRLLVTKNFIIPFESGVIVVVDWNVNNTLKNDRYHETFYKSEKSSLMLDSSGRYMPGSKPEPERFQIGSKPEPELNVTEHNKTEHSKDCAAVPRPTHPKFAPPTVEEVAAYVQERGSKVDPQQFVDFYAAKGWMIGKTPMKDWKAACRNAEKWERWQKPAQPGGYNKPVDRPTPSGNNFLQHGARRPLRITRDDDDNDPKGRE